MKTTAQVIGFICLTLLFFWCLMPSHISGPISTHWESSVEVQKFGEPVETTSYMSACSGKIVAQWTERRRVRHNKGYDWEDEWHYKYLPWKRQAMLVASGKASPAYADDSGFPNGEDWRRVRQMRLWWIVGGRKVVHSQQGAWQQFEDGAICDVTHRFGHYVAAQRHSAETAEDFDF